jgi:hypothetical protein
MTLIVEDGTGLTNANSIISVAELDDWADDRGYDLSGYDTADKEAALITSTMDFFEVYYTFKGDPVNPDQALQLPTDEVEINAKIKQAYAQGAYYQLQGLLFVDHATSNSAEIKRLREKVGPIEEETEYTEGSRKTYKISTPIIDRLLAPYVLAAGFGGLRRGI